MSGQTGFTGSSGSPGATGLPGSTGLQGISVQYFVNYNSKFVDVYHFMSANKKIVITL